jgi:glutathione synthase/RimK-type ligase-like ATP-grasp enzyme
MILVAGDPGEAPTRLVLDALDAIGAAPVILGQNALADACLEARIGGASTGGAVTGILDTGSKRIALEQVSAVYLRLLGHDLPVAAMRLLGLLDVLPARVLNRPAAMASNASKPFQALAARAAGFAIPETLVTNDPGHARAFVEAAWDGGGEVIYKSASGIRSIVETVAPDDLSRLGAIRWCPVQFQHRVPGTDLRLHVVGQSVFAARIRSDATDYRYAARQTGTAAGLEAIDIGAGLAGRAVKLSAMLDLPLAGIDLRETPGGEFVCFEANPSPAFSYYEKATGLPIAHAIAAHLAGESA